MLLKFAISFCSAAVLAAAVTVAAQGPERPTRPASPGAACAALKNLTFGDAKVVESTPVPSGSLKISDTITIPGLP